jgi:hypothetical protein
VEGYGMRLLFVSFMLSLCWPFGAFSRTWYVRNDGTGDAPTIQAAVDSASSGDTVLVGPGTYSSANEWPVIIENKNGLTVVSESGSGATQLMDGMLLNHADSTSVIGFTLENTYCGLIIWWSHDVLVENNVIRNVSMHSGLDVQVVSETVIRNNLVYNCGYFGMHIYDASGDIEVSFNTIAHCAMWGIYTDAAPMLIANNIICFNNGGISSLNPWWSIFSCNDVYGNGTNYSLWGMGDPTGMNGNISVDPLFCGVDPAVSGNYFLQSISPCAPGNHPDGYSCGLIGARPVNCGATSTEQTTWGRIKSLYR